MIAAPSVPIPISPWEGDQSISSYGEGVAHYRPATARLPHARSLECAHYLGELRAGSSDLFHAPAAAALLPGLQLTRSTPPKLVVMFISSLFIASRRRGLPAPAFLDEDNRA